MSILGQAPMNKVHRLHRLIQILKKSPRITRIITNWFYFFATENTEVTESYRLQLGKQAKKSKYFLENMHHALLEAIDKNKSLPKKISVISVICGPLFFIL